MTRVLPYGPAAWLVDEVQDPAAWARGLTAWELDGIEEVIPAESSVVVRCERAVHEEVGAHLVGVRPAPRTGARSAVVIEVIYDGDDLADMSAATGLSTEQVIELHCGADYHVAFCGFSPGFAYLAGLPEALHLPRRARPRTRVPAGSVAVAAHYSAVYPTPSPGGWHLLGRTAMSVWDTSRQPPALLRPGTPVRFERR